MIDVMTWATLHNFGSAWADHHRLRHVEFIEQKGWNVPTYDGMEFDQFDTPAAVYLIKRGENGEAAGVARLIPTTQPYMLDALWPEMLGELAGAKSPMLWEATRLAVNPNLTLRSRARLAKEVVYGCIELGVEMGIEQFFVLTTTRVLRRVIGGVGAQYDILAESDDFGPERVAAVRVTVDGDTMARGRRILELDGPLISQRSLDLCFGGMKEAA